MLTTLIANVRLDPFVAEHVLVKEGLPGVSLFAQLALEGAGPHLLVLPHVVVQIELVDKVLLANFTLIRLLALEKKKIGILSN